MMQFLLQIAFLKLTGYASASIDSIQVKINDFLYNEILHV